MKSHEPSARSRLACLGEPSRFSLVQTLSQGERCVTDLARAVGLSQPCTTRHLQTLVREGLVRGRRDGKRVVFALRSDVPPVRLLLDWALSHPVELAAARRPERGAGKPATNGARSRGPRTDYAEPAPRIPRPASEIPPAVELLHAEADDHEDREVEAPAPRRYEDLEDFLL